MFVLGEDIEALSFTQEASFHLLWEKQSMINGGYFVCNRRDKQRLMGLWGGMCVVHDDEDQRDLGAKAMCRLLCVCALGTSEVLMVKQNGFSDTEEEDKDEVTCALIHTQCTLCVLTSWGQTISSNEG